MRRSALPFLLVVLLALAALAVLAASERRSLAFTLGAPSLIVATTLEPGQQACQGPILAEEAFDAVEVHLGTFARSGPRLAVAVEPATGGAPIARGTLAAGYPDNARSRVTVGHVPADASIAVCLRNEGAAAVAVYGAPDAAARASTATLDGEPTANDLDLSMHTADARSTLGELPRMLGRAALFRGDWIGPWLYWALLVLLVLGVPALLARALSATTPASERGGESPPRRREPDAVPSSSGTGSA